MTSSIVFTHAASAPDTALSLHGLAGSFDVPYCRKAALAPFLTPFASCPVGLATAYAPYALIFAGVDEIDPDTDPVA
jgi:hypothetical protein